jgi:hypothetical protein
MDKYFKILGLNSSASKGEIKKAYRKLAFQYHPDKNSDPKAQEYFVLITLAYDSLMNPNQTVSKTTTTARKTENSVEERMKRAKARQAYQNARKAKQEERFFKKLTIGSYWRTLNILMILGCIAASVTLLDIFLPYHQRTVEIKQIQFIPYRGIANEDLSELYATDGTHVLFNGRWKGDLISRKQRIVTANKTALADIYKKTKKHKIIRTVQLRETWLSHTIVEVGFHNPGLHKEALKYGEAWVIRNFDRIIATNKIDYLWSKADFHFMLLPWMFVLLFLCPLIARLQKSKTLRFTIFYTFSLYIISPVLAYYWLTQYRIFHIITLGFW